MGGSTHNPLVHYSVLTIKLLHLLLFHLVQQHISCESKCKKRAAPRHCVMEMNNEHNYEKYLDNTCDYPAISCQTGPCDTGQVGGMMHAGDRIRLGLGSCSFFCVCLVHATHNGYTQFTYILANIFRCAALTSGTR